MTRLLNTTMLLLIGMGLLVGGCGNGDDDDGGGGTGGGGGGTRGGGGGTARAGTPEQALENFQAAMLAGDKNAIANCMDGSDKQIEFFTATSEMNAVGARFRDAMKKAYGDDVLTGVRGNPMPGQGSLEGFEIKIDGDTAVATEPARRDVVKLVKKGGLWKIDANAMISEEKLERDSQRMRMMKAMMEAQKAVMGKIGQPGYSAEKINEEFAEAMVEAMRSSRPTPPTPPMPRPE